ncbi:MAG: Rpn family recombination-promoting nuclease/putative transposase [Muribaculaceae bacterium]|nr:Rpn family recombination-promoting nuclease/putative transposase [Muribaculaceae bacterium]
MRKYIDPFTDTGFKIIFGKENQSEILLAGFLNTLFENQPYFEKIIGVNYLNSERVRDKERGKTIIHDVICQTQSGHRFILEMQKGKKDDFMHRSTYYTCKGITDQINIAKDQKGPKFKYLPVTSVYVCQFNVKGVEKKLVSHFMYKDVDTNHILNNGIRTTYIQLPEFDKEWEECKTKFEQWIYILQHMNEFSEFPVATRKDEVFSRLERVASYSALSEEDRIAYEADLKWASEYEEEIATAKREAAQEARTEGRAEGRAEGEKQKAVEVAKTAISMGLDDQAVQQLSGLPIEEIQKLK